MSAPRGALFSGHPIAVIFDFDQTLIPGYQQQVLFDHFGRAEAMRRGRTTPAQIADHVEQFQAEFWDDARRAPAEYARQGIRVDPETVYLSTLLSWVHDGRMPGLSNAILRELGRGIRFYPGAISFLRQLQRAVNQDARNREAGVTLELYVLSQGMRQLMLGSGIAAAIPPAHVYGGEVIESLLPARFPGGSGAANAGGSELTALARGFNSVDKTRALFEISKGANVDPSIDVNSVLAEQDRRIPLDHIVYVADGPTDVPMWAIVGRGGGRTLGVWNPESPHHRLGVKSLLHLHRVEDAQPADYRPGKEAAATIQDMVREIRDHILADVRVTRHAGFVNPAGHITTRSPRQLL